MLWPCTWTGAAHFLGYFAAACDIFVSIRDHARSAAPLFTLSLACSRGAFPGDLAWVVGEGCLGASRLAEGDSLAASSRLCAARELGLPRAFAWANSMLCCVATWARKPAA